MANNLLKSYPPSLEAIKKKKLSVDRISKILEKIYADAQAFKTTNNMGLFGKTRLCHAFKWQLTELGYSKSFVDVATEGLVVYLSKSKTSPRQ